MEDKDTTALKNTGRMILYSFAVGYWAIVVIANLKAAIDFYLNEYNPSTAPVRIIDQNHTEGKTVSTDVVEESIR